MNFYEIKNKLKNKSSITDNSYKRSSVIVLLTENENDIHILFNQRSLKLKNQPGDICFPGGHQDENETSIETVYREIFEELGITKENIEIIQKYENILTYGRGIITPFLGILKNTKLENIKYNTDEVENIFTIPLSFFIENEPQIYNIYYEPILSDNFPYHLIRNGKNYKFLKINSPQYFYIYNDVVIWGITAKILKNIIDIIK